MFVRCLTNTRPLRRETMDNWMEDRLNGGYGHILNQLQAEDEFRLGRPSWDDDGWPEDSQEIEIISEEND